MPVNAAEFSALQSKSAVKVAVVVRTAAWGTSNTLSAVLALTTALPAGGGR